MRVAIVHEWISASAGSEKVFGCLARSFPNADLYCLSYDKNVRLDGLADRKVTTTILDRQMLRSRRSATLPMMPLAWRLLKRPTYDLVVTSSHAFSRYFVRPADGLHFSYVHTPMRYAWSPELDDRSNLLGPLANIGRTVLKALDSHTVDRTQLWAANSTETRRRIRSMYGANAEVIHPPVEFDRFANIAVTKADYIVALSRFVRYKRLDLAIDAAEVARVPLLILGRGPDSALLRALAARSTVPVTVVDNPSDRMVAEALAAARALVFPAKEDFGIVPVEAQAAGTPVVAVRGFGADDTVAHGVTGALVEHQTADSLAKGIQQVLRLDVHPDACRSNAKRFAEPYFKRKIRAWVERGLEANGVR